ncbi:MAG: alpha/beta hydrolase [Polyangiales bacterium]
MAQSTNPHNVPTIDYAEHRWVELRGAKHCYLEAGTGDKTVLLLHGYPDNAYSWEHQIRFLSDKGYRVLVPFTRGYPPTQVADGAYFDRATLASDVDQLIEALNDGEPVDLVGQDWGAAISYGVLAAFPQRIRRAVLLAVPHPVEIRRTLRRSPKHAVRSFHWFLFQLPAIPELLIRGSRGGFLRFLWRLWSPAFDDAAHVDQVVETMLSGRSVEETLSYYRAALQPKFRDPALSGVFSKLDDVITVPTRVLCGEQDMRREMLSRQGDLFDASATYEWETVPDSGHFLHREKPDIVNERILDWITRPA